MISPLPNQNIYILGKYKIIEQFDDFFNLTLQLIYTFLILS